MSAKENRNVADAFGALFRQARFPPELTPGLHQRVHYSYSGVEQSVSGGGVGSERTAPTGRHREASIYFDAAIENGFSSFASRSQTVGSRGATLAPPPPALGGGGGLRARPPSVREHSAITKSRSLTTATDGGSIRQRARRRAPDAVAAVLPNPIRPSIQDDMLALQQVDNFLKFSRHRRSGYGRRSRNSSGPGGSGGGGSGNSTSKSKAAHASGKEGSACGLRCVLM